MLAWPSHSWTLGDVGLVVERVSGGCRAQGMGTDLDPSAAEYLRTSIVNRHLKGTPSREAGQACPDSEREGAALPFGGNQA
jgi:hypothetical protein